MSMGQIPWTAMVDWCLFNGLDDFSSRHLINVLRAIDLEIVRRADAKTGKTT